MRDVQSLQQDCVTLAFEKFRRGEVSRRTLLAGLAALGATPLLGGETMAQVVRQLVMVNWGGIANQSFGQFYGDPFTVANPGMRVVQDSTGPSAGRLRSMVESGRVTWDICDSSATFFFLPGGMNLLNRVDRDVVKRDDAIDPTLALQHGAAPHSCGNVLIYDSSKFPQGAPTSWADFWDLRRFPGMRLLRRDASAALVPEEFKRFNPAEPANARLQVAQDGRWWGANYAQANADDIDMVTG